MESNKQIPNFNRVEAFGNKLGLSSPRTSVKELRRELKRGQKIKKERSTLIDPNTGKVIRFTVGEEGSANVSAEIAWLKENPNKKAIHVHNHPKSIPPSSSDILLLGDLKEMIILGHNGKVWRMRLGAGMGREETFVVMANLRDRIDNLRLKGEKLYLKKLIEGILEVQAGIEITRVIMKEAFDDLVKSEGLLNGELIRLNSIINYEELEGNLLELLGEVI